MRTNGIMTLAAALAASLALGACASKGKVPAEPEIKVDLCQVGMGYAKSSVNGAIFRHSPLCTADSAGVTLQFACYYDKAGRLTVAKRRLGSNDWQVADLGYRGHVEDGHNVAVMTADARGYLHISYDHHGHKLHYRRSVEPFSLQFTDEMPMVGANESDVTYPEFHALADGSLLFAYRTGISGRGNMVLNAYDPAKQEWSRVQTVLIDGERKRNAYWQMTTDKAGTLHLSWVWRETAMVETNHDICYARSSDGGKTWTRSDGTAYKLPITMATAEVAWQVPQKSELINQTSMSCDADGHPYIATYWREKADSVPQYRVVWHDGKAWQAQAVSKRRAPFSLSGWGTKMIPMSRPAIFVTPQGGGIFVCRDAERGSVVTVYSTRDIAGGEWKATDVTDFAVNAWEPSFDASLWNAKGQVMLFVQDVRQGDGEHTVEAEPTAVNVMKLSLPWE